MTDERRAVLEAIAYGPDASIKPGERLRALELLDSWDGGHHCFCDEIARLDYEELHRQEDHLMAAMLICLDDPARRERWPETMAALDQEVAQHVSEARRDGSLRRVVSTDTVVAPGDDRSVRTSA